MKTLYIDVYFLINFTVDLLAIYFASRISRVPVSTRRGILAAIVGGISASVIVFLESELVSLLLSVLSLVLIVYVAAGKVSARRRGKLLFSFLIFEALTGGAAYYLWSFLDEFVYDKLSTQEGGAQNRKLLLFSILVLLSIGVFKMIVSFFSNLECEGSVKFEISFLGKSVSGEAFVDSGNLAMDPMDMRPVMFIKRELAEKLFPESVIELSDPDKLDRAIRKRIRLLPVTRGGQTHVLTGMKVDSVRVLGDMGEGEIAVTVAIDKEGGNYGGFSALMPSAAICDVHKA
ncbi:MAG: sigma-E processing peptidase SpoIIGA [Clostridia bacterium]|nr:sigma-E processing peptidase SpoIIGA [Clostridia bacterium]